MALPNKVVDESMVTATAEIIELTPKVEPRKVDTSSNNLVKRTVFDLLALLSQAQEHREELMARGVQDQTIKMLVEMGFHNRVNEQAKLAKTALEASCSAHGETAITAEQLDSHLAQLLALERDIAHIRRLARQQGLNLPALNTITFQIQQNPGDGGKNAVNTILAYAQACNIELDGIEQITQQIESEKKSVLPDIPRRSLDQQSSSRQKIVKEVLLGLSLGIFVLWMII